MAVDTGVQSGFAWSRGELGAFVDEVVAPRAAEADRTGRIDPDVLSACAARGLWGAVLPVAQGGTGVGMVALARLHEEAGRGCSALRSLLTVHSMALYALHRWGTDGVRQRWQAALVAGEALGAFCLTEAEAGSDFAAIRTSARQRGDGWILDGHKLWVTGGQLADVLLVFARTQTGPAAFVVDAANPGVRRIPVPGVTGTRGSQVAEIVLDHCELPLDAIVGPEGMGLAVATGVLDIGRFSVAAGCVGILQACLRACVDYAGLRRQGGAPLRDHQLVQQLISAMAVDTRAARALVGQAARLKDEGSPDTIMATCIAKQFAATAAVAAANDAVQLHGARGCSDDYPVGRYLRDAKVMEIIEGSTQMQHVLIADDACRNRARVVIVE
ncbi:acyl-CoA dehydrogenase family protein [Nocardia harenae]|uniref:acyl-CoA dehydrogenase family protein n=1 Tax=Nocardia harenae TaxID=358707 RepID=UPI000829B9A3|nr:acyl-CoA dehydrogenase family protein [Nocardia harenae]